MKIDDYTEPLDEGPLRVACIGDCQSDVTEAAVEIIIVLGNNSLADIQKPQVVCSTNCIEIALEEQFLILALWISAS